MKCTYQLRATARNYVQLRATARNYVQLRATARNYVRRVSPRDRRGVEARSGALPKPQARARLRL